MDCGTEILYAGGLQQALKLGSTGTCFPQTER